MAESVNTGGIKRFDYSKGKRSKLSPDKKKEIEDAYGQYEIRKKKERRNKIILWIIIALAVLAGVWWLFLK